jgi:hypothetical protein
MDPVRPPVLFKLQRLYFLSAMPRSGREHEFWWPYVPSPAYLSPAYLLCSWCAQRYPALVSHLSGVAQFFLSALPLSLGTIVLIQAVHFIC